MRRLWFYQAHPQLPPSPTPVTAEPFLLKGLFPGGGHDPLSLTRIAFISMGERLFTGI